MLDKGASIIRTECGRIYIYIYIYISIYIYYLYIFIYMVESYEATVGNTT